MAFFHLLENAYNDFIRYTNAFPDVFSRQISTWLCTNLPIFSWSLVGVQPVTWAYKLENKTLDPKWQKSLMLSVARKHILSITVTNM
eukprot:942090-Pleurochrysis_carterae.AAC.2